MDLNIKCKLVQQMNQYLQNACYCTAILINYFFLLHITIRNVCVFPAPSPNLILHLCAVSVFPCRSGNNNASLS